MSTVPPQDWLAPQAFLVARLRELVPALASVVTVDDLLTLEHAQVPLPSAEVVYGGYAVVAAREGTAPVLRTTWFVGVRVEAVPAASGSDATAANADATTGATVRGVAGPLVHQVFAALSGYRPCPGWSRLVIADGPDPDYRDGVLTVPIAFTTNFSPAPAAPSAY